MNWVTVIASSLTGALGALVGGLIAGLLTRKREGGFNRQAMIIGLVLGAAAGTQLLGPKLSAWYEVRNAEASLLETPVYAVLKKHEPAAYAKILAEFKRVLGDPAQTGAFTSMVMNEVSAVTSRRMATASNESIVALIGEMVSTLRKLQGNGDACFRYLFPQVAGTADVTQLLDKSAEDRSLALLAEVIRTSAEHPAEPVPAEVAQEKLTPVLQGLGEEFGADTQMLANVSAVGVDRQKVCAITISLYDRILKLPPADAAAVLRSLAQST